MDLSVKMNKYSLHSLMRRFSKYSFMCFVHAAEFGAVMLIRITLIFLLLNSFGLKDSNAYAIYAIFAITMDSAGILGAYIAHNLLTSRLSWLLGFTIFAVGGVIGAISVGVDINLFYFALTLLTAGIGIMKCNSLVITNDYIKEEIHHKHQGDYNSIMYLTMIAASFFAVFSSGIILKYLNYETIFYASLAVNIVSANIFLLSEWKTIKKEMKTHLFSSKQFTLYKKFILVSLLTGVFSFLYLLFQNNLSIIVKHLPLAIFVIFYAYLIFRALKNHGEKKYIYFAMVYSLVLTFYISLEKQIETIFALFVKRNVDKVVFGYEIPTLNINSFFQLSIVLIGIYFFTKKLQSKLKESTVIAIILFFSAACFAMLYLGATLNELYMVKLRYYLMALIILALGDVFVYSKLMSVARIMPNALKNILSSFMMINVSFGFYLCRIYADLVAIDKNATDSAYSLVIYQGHFLRMVVISVIFSAAMFIFYQLKGKKILQLRD